MYNDITSQIACQWVFVYNVPVYNAAGLVARVEIAGDAAGWVFCEPSLSTENAVMMGSIIRDSVI